MADGTRRVVAAQHQETQIRVGHDVFDDALDAQVLGLQ
jgi:hypothetical protein